jgi:aconitate hydratase
MGVLPLQFPAGSSADSLGLDGTEIFDIEGVEALNEGITPKTLKVTAKPSSHSESGKKDVVFDAVLRIDTPGEADYFRHGGILQYVLRSLVSA